MLNAERIVKVDLRLGQFGSCRPQLLFQLSSLGVVAEQALSRFTSRAGRGAG
jgi:hypothetical protein